VDNVASESRNHSSAEADPAGATRPDRFFLPPGRGDFFMNLGQIQRSMTNAGFAILGPVATRIGDRIVGAVARPAVGVWHAVANRFRREGP
jgi:hypothetical protein